MSAPELPAGIPAALRERMLEALAEVSPGTSPMPGAAPAPGEVPPPGADQMMLAAALDRLQRVLASSGERASALDLLAADALLTDAVAAAAEGGPAALTAFVEEALARIGALLPEAGATPDTP